MPRVKRVLMLLGLHAELGRGIAQGVLAYCRSHGNWHLEVDGGMDAPRTLKRMEFLVHRWKADAIIAQAWTPTILSRLLRFGLPCVDCSGTWNSMNPLRVHADNLSVGRLVARHFLERGLRHFAYYGQTKSFHSIQRLEGFTAELAAAGFDCRTIGTRSRRANQIDLIEEEMDLIRWLRGLPKPIGIMACNDPRANTLVQAGQAAGIAIPDQLAVVGVDNDAFTSVISPTPISSVDVCPTRIGYAAAEVLDQILKGGKAPTQPVLIEPAGVICRLSSDVLAVENQEVAEAIRFIREHAAEAIEVSDILEAVPISRRSLEIHFSRLLGRTPSQQIRHERLKLAKGLLRDTDQSVSAVATRSGFTDPSLFAVIFRRNTGKTPSQYRKETRKR